MVRGTFRIKIIIFGFLLGLILIFTGCTGIFYIPGASYGYYIWEEDESIVIEWSADREWEEKNDVIKVEENKVEFSASLDSKDYSDGFSFWIAKITQMDLVLFCRITLI